MVWWTKRCHCDIACVAGPQFYGGPDLQRAGFWRARGRIEGLQENPPFMTTRRSDSERWIRSPDWSIPRQWKTVVFVDFNIVAYQLSNLNRFLILNCWTSWLFFLVQQRYKRWPHRPVVRK
jgi:hypothetical protein